MAKLGFNTGSGANAMERAGKVTGMMLGKLVQAIEPAMKALSEPKKFMENATMAVQASVQKLASKATKPFVNNDGHFNASINPGRSGPKPAGP